MKTLRSVLAVALAVTMMLTMVVSFSTSAAAKVLTINDMETLYKGGTFNYYGEDNLGIFATDGASTPETYGYLFVDLSAAMAETPYLVYQIEECDGGWLHLCPGGLWGTDGMNIQLEVDNTRHVVDLRDKALNDAIWFQVTFWEGFKASKFYLTDNPDGDAPQGGDDPQGGDEPATGAETLVIPCVALLATSAVAIVASKKRK